VIEDLAIEVLVIEVLAIEVLVIEVLVTAEKDVMMILKAIDAQNLAAQDLIDLDVLDEEINLLQSSIYYEKFQNLKFHLKFWNFAFSVLNLSPIAHRC
jgi:hypothetical protein